MQLYYDSFNSPIGIIRVVVDRKGVKKISIFEEEWLKYKKYNKNIEKNEIICKSVITQLNEYFKRQRYEFDIPLSLDGTEFQVKIWKAVLKIPYGEIRSYSQIAQEIGNPKAVRAIGQANKANKIPIIIPCHRVIGKNGKLVGYAGDKIGIKDKLLTLEKEN